MSGNNGLEIVDGNEVYNEKKSDLNYVRCSKIGLVVDDINEIIDIGIESRMDHDVLIKLKGLKDKLFDIADSMIAKSMFDL